MKKKVELLEVKRLLEAGLPNIEIAKKFEISAGRVSQIRKQLGFPRLRKQVSPEDIKKLKKLHARKYSDREIARELGLQSTATIRYYRRKLGLLPHYKAGEYRKDNN